MAEQLTTVDDAGRRRRWFARGWRALRSSMATMRAEAELRAMDERELRDLGLGRGAIGYVSRHGREVQ